MNPEVRSVPIRSAVAMYTLLTCAAVIVRYAAMQVPLASYSGGGVHTQPVGMQMMSAPCWATIRAVSGNQMSQQTNSPIRPILVWNTG
jgi:hypothetical protein